MKIKQFVLRQIFHINTYGVQELFRKFYLFIKVLLMIPINIISVVPCVIIRLVSPWIIIRIAKAPSGNYGIFVRALALYCCKKKLKIDQLTKKHIDLFYIPPTNKVYNRQLEKMWKRKINFFPGYLLDPINRVNKLIPGGKIHALEIGPGHDFDNLNEKYQPLDFTVEEEIQGKKMLNKFGLKNDDKFICLAVRDGAYQLKKIPSKFCDWSYHDYRHWDLDNFILAAEELTKRGYYVFRMGVVVNKPFNSNNPKIIDYANSNLRSDFMDVYLGAKCSFCLSTGFGFEALPYLFMRPLAVLQMPLGDLCAYNEKCLFITKHHILKKEKRKLSLSEIFSCGAAYVYETKIFEEKGIELVDNTPDEIKDLAIEMVENLESQEKLNSEDEELKKTFRSLYATNVKRYIERYELPGEWEDLRNLTNVPIRSCFSTKFLRKNKDWFK